MPPDPAYYESSTHCQTITNLTNRVIPVLSSTRTRSAYMKRQSINKANLIYVRREPKAPATPPTFSVGLWNCQSAVNKSNFIPALASHLSLSLLALTETWIRPEDTTTPSALAINHGFTHTSRPSGRGGGTGCLVANDWSFIQLAPEKSFASFEFHAIMLLKPFKMYVLVLYRLPGHCGQFPTN